MLQTRLQKSWLSKVNYQIYLKANTGGLLAATRVYILAKELSVKSSAIVTKCMDEGLDVKNHMSAISAGLAATIREWFSEGENVTTVETSSKVDLEKVRVRKRPALAKVGSEGDDESSGDQDSTSDDLAVAVEEAPETPVTSEVVEDQIDVVAEVDTPDVADDVPLPEIIEPETQPEEALSEPADPEAEEAAVEAPEASETPEKFTPAQPPAPRIIEPPKPEPVVPAGPMLGKPQPAKLSGPKVVRIEAPEPVRQHKPRTARPRYDKPVTQPLVNQGPAPEAGGGGKGKHRGKGHAPVRGRAVGESASQEAARKAKARQKWRQRDIDERRARVDAAGGEGMRLRPSRKVNAQSGQSSGPATLGTVTVVEPITVKDLCSAMAVKASDLIKKLMGHGVMATANMVISGEVAELVAIDFDVELEVEYKKAHEDEIKIEFENRERKHLTRRPVVATMLGHVDHGKTSLLDRIRSSQVAAGEAGGITQHIGASQIKLGEKVVTFLDTPGHEAFTAMRARGANMTDVVVLVVAADDGVMPQTIEAIAHSKAADVPIIVALNKIDLPGCDINRIYAQLSEHGLTPTEWSGETEIVKTSAQTGEGIEDLLEHLDFVAELLNLEADDTIPAMGWVVEARMSPKRGTVATVLLKEGRLRKGDVVLSGRAYGRVKMLKNSQGRTIKEAVSSMPIEVTGLSDVPEAGEPFYCLGDDIVRAKNAAAQNKSQMREDSLAQRSQVTLENLFSQIEAGSVKELKLILRADVKGSVEVLRKHLLELSVDEVKINILHAAAGGITEGDVILAEASNAIIIGFNVVADERAAKIAESKGVDIRLYSIIYRITEDLKKSMAGLLDPEEKENTLGRAAIRQTFKVTAVGTIAGCMVTSGVARKNAKIRLIRDNVIMRDNVAIDSLKHFKDDVREVRAGLECGVKIAGFDDVKMDDVLEFYEIVKIARTL
jgi:translation initiation factor IF-2